MLFWQMHGHATFLNRRCLHRVRAVHGNCAFGVAVRFGGVGEPDPGGGKNGPADLVRRRHTFGTTRERPATYATCRHVLHAKLFLVFAWHYLGLQMAPLTLCPSG